MPQTGGDKPGKVNIDKISGEVVCLAAMKAALSVPGVYGLCDTLTGNLTRIIGAKDNDLIGVKVSGDKTALTIDLYVIVLFGVYIAVLISRDANTSPIVSLAGSYWEILNVPIDPLASP